MTDSSFFDHAMAFAGATHRMSVAADVLVGQRIRHIVVDVRHPPFATFEQHPVSYERMWRWGTFSGVDIWSRE